jgi:hypothetical protein
MKTAARDSGKHRLDLVGVQGVRWENIGTEWAKDYTFFYAEGNGDNQLETGFFSTEENHMTG